MKTIFINGSPKKKFSASAYFLSVQKFFVKGEKISEVLRSKKDHDRILKMWNVYTSKNKYANGLSFEIIITELKLFISTLELDEIKI